MAKAAFSNAPTAGLLTKTIIRSPVVHWLLHARLRNKNINDVVFVGDTFIHVKQVGREGHLEHIASKTDFDARIRAAKVFSNDSDQRDEDLLLKTEDDSDSTGASTLPLDLLVVTLSTHDLLFLYLDTDNDGKVHFVQQACPLPTFGRMLYQPEQHLAIEPQSRALAVAANEREVLIFSAKGGDRLRHEIGTRQDNWCPISAQRPIKIEGVIQHMDFLIPPDDDPDHVILLLIVVHQRVTKAVHIDWYCTSDLHSATLNVGLPLFSERTVSSLLIPLRDAAFLVVTGNKVRKYKKILSGSTDCLLLNILESDPQHCGNSPLQPVWASWCRPPRERYSMRDKDHLYLAREDGLVYLLHAYTNDVVTSTSAGHLECHVGTAFASLGTTIQPDILAVAGSMSTGKVVSMGHWPPPQGRAVTTLDWNETMKMDLVQTVPNWASATDMVTMTPPSSHGRAPYSRDSVFVTSGRQPYGSITELRHGLEARLSAYFELDELHAVSAMWSLPLDSQESLLLLFATPTTTRFLLMDCEYDLTQPNPIDVSALDAGHRTVAAAVTKDGLLVQVTERSICVTADLVANFEDSAKSFHNAGHTIVAAAIEPNSSLILTAETKSGTHTLRCMRAPSADEPTILPTTVPAENIAQLADAPLAVAIALHKTGTLALVSTADCALTFFMISDSGQLSLAFHLPNALGICDHVTLLQSTNDINMMALCALRDGRLLTLTFSLAPGGVLQPLDRHVFPFGHTTARLIRMAQTESQVVAMSGTDTCLISWDGQDARSITVHNLWVSDKLQPGFAQGPVTACCEMPSAEFLSGTDIAGSLVMVSEGNFLVTTVDPNITTVPRQLHLSGTPNRLLYSEQHRCLVVASLHTAVRSFPTPQSRPEQRRQIWPVIDFIPSRGDKSTYTYSLQPGERVYALLEWTFTREDKTYSFILVGGSYIRRSGAEGGRVHFLQPSQTDRRITGATAGATEKFEAAVYALALYDGLTYVVCYGDFVCLWGFNSELRRWQERCLPFRLASSGVNVTVQAPLMHIATTRDSFVTLRFDPENVREGETLPRLVMAKTGPQAENTLSHIVVNATEATAGNVDEAQAGHPVMLVSTKDRRVVGFASPTNNNTDSSAPRAADMLFEAHLPSSLTRLRRANIRPSWKASPEDGVLVDDMVGIAADGTLVGMALINERLWRRLFWLQRLCEWNEALSPYVCQEPPYTTTTNSVLGGYSQSERAVPVGLSGGGVVEDCEEIMLHTSVSECADRHIDGDVLARLVAKGGGAEMLRSVLLQAADGEGPVGDWVSRHLEEELAAVEETIEMLRAVLDCWI